VIDRFTYTVTDENGLTSTATVEVTVTGVEDGISRAGTNGNDRIAGTAGEDSLSGGNGADVIEGLGGHDALFGGNGDDVLLGGSGNDLLVGGTGADRLFGGDGDDRFYGGRGDDYLAGGAGSDEFVFGRSGGRDTIADFDVTQDRILLGEGIRLSSSRVSDVDGDGIADLTLTFSHGSSAVLLGVSDLSKVSMVAEHGPML
jgi:Ca2+-binding RTX toxin-like protein